VKFSSYRVFYLSIPYVSEEKQEKKTCPKAKLSRILAKFEPLVSVLPCKVRLLRLERQSRRLQIYLSVLNLMLQLLFMLLSSKVFFF